MKVCEVVVVVLVGVGVAAFVLPAKMCVEARIPKQITLSFMCMYASLYILYINSIYGKFTYRLVWRTNMVTFNR